MSLALVGGGNDDTPHDFFVKPCCQLHNEASSLLSQHAWAAQERRQKAWEITWELVPKCVAILGPSFWNSTQRKKNLEGIESRGVNRIRQYCSFCSRLVVLHVKTTERTDESRPCDDLHPNEE